MTVPYLMGAALAVVAVAAVVGVALLPMLVPFDVPEPLGLLWSFAVGVEFMKINHRIWNGGTSR